jgi:peptidoglycan/LPS O-acetylase OafA/YrhL
MKPWLGLLLAAAGLTLIYFLWTFNLGWPRGIKIGLPAFLTVFGFLVSEPLWQRYNPLRQFARLGDASYSIYIVHFFFVTALATLFKTQPALHDALGPIGYTLLAIALGIGGGILAHLFVEKPLLRLVRGRLPKGRTSRLVPAVAKF